MASEAHCLGTVCPFFNKYIELSTQVEKLKEAMRNIQDLSSDVAVSKLTEQGLKPIREEIKNCSTCQTCKYQTEMLCDSPCENCLHYVEIKDRWESKQKG
jgi:predicted GTPase